MKMLDRMRSYGGLLLDLHGLLQHTLSLDEARAILCERLRERQENFLRLVECAVFGHRASPYLPLLDAAGCELGDIQRMVRTTGVESTLRALRDADVYVTYEEFKGRHPLTRNGRAFPVTSSDFDNPRLVRQLEATSGGSTGPATRTPLQIAHFAGQAPYLFLERHAYGVTGVPTAVWRGILPDASGFHNVLCSALCGQPAERWFSQIVARDLRLSRLKTDMATKALVAAARLSGSSFPWPESVRLEDASVVARWAAEKLRSGGACLILTQVSRALRVCLAARELSVDLTGATFVVGGEPPTAAKVQGITDSGARCFPVYAFSEAGGRVGTGCANPHSLNDQHLHTDGFAVLSHPRPAAGTGVTVPALLITSLLPTSPKVLINVENDDHGVLETRACGCPFGDLGFTEHLRDIWSFSKLTGEGVSLVESEITTILEEVLPARFGGSPLDYQLLEEEDERGFTRLSLIVSPHIPIPDERLLIDVALGGLRKVSLGADQARDIWHQANALRVKRIPPIWTGRGKLMPLYQSRNARLHDLPRRSSAHRIGSES